MPPLQDTWSDDAVFERTELGRQLVTAAQCDLPPLEQRLLRMLTGYTPIKDLLALMSEPPQPAQIGRLLRDGLIRRVNATIVRGAADRLPWAGEAHRHHGH